MTQEGYILVVESDDLIRELVERWLGEAGYTVVARALRKLRENGVREGAPCLVIVDIPSPRGAEELIGSLQAVYPAPILALSARFRHGLDKSTDVAAQLGVRKVLPKPFTRRELLGAVAESIGGS